MTQVPRAQYLQISEEVGEDGEGMVVVAGGGWRLCILTVDGTASDSEAEKWRKCIRILIKNCGFFK